MLGIIQYRFYSCFQYFPVFTDQDKAEIDIFKHENIIITAQQTENSPQYFIDIHPRFFQQNRILKRNFHNAERFFPLKQLVQIFRQRIRIKASQFTFQIRFRVFNNDRQNQYTDRTGESHDQKSII